jgi:hypothetical protein
VQSALCHRRTVRTEMEIDMAEIRNIHGQGRFVDGRATGETFVDFGEVADNRYVRVRVRSSEDGHTIELDIDGEMCAFHNDAPSMKVLINGALVLDTADGGPWPTENPRG